MMKARKIRIMFTNVDIVTEPSKSQYLWVATSPRPTTVRAISTKGRWRSELPGSRIENTWPRPRSSLDPKLA